MILIFSVFDTIHIDLYHAEMIIFTARLMLHQIQNDLHGIHQSDRASVVALFNQLSFLEEEKNPYVFVMFVLSVFCPSTVLRPAWLPSESEEDIEVLSRSWRPYISAVLFMMEATSAKSCNDGEIELSTCMINISRCISRPFWKNTNTPPPRFFPIISQLACAGGGWTVIEWNKLLGLM